MAILLVQPANAARRPTHTERAHIVAVTKAYVIDSEVTRVEVDKTRVSSIDRDWALVSLETFGHGGNSANTALGPLDVLLYRDVDGRWRALYESDREADDQTRWFRMGCLLTPAVRRDLELVCRYRD